MDHLATSAQIPEDLARVVCKKCKENETMGVDGAVDLDMTNEKLHEIFGSRISDSPDQNRLFNERRDKIFEIILKSRYRNIHALLGDQIGEDYYLGVVRNQVLVDIQGSDILLQIFTCNILQRKQGEEAPFLEFIQRVCSESKGPAGRGIKPGCGGFG